MVSAALGTKWECVLANDIDPVKCAAYRQNWNLEVLIEGDVGALPSSALRQPVDMYWASPPCQDLSLAGKGAGLTGSRSSAFYSWYETIRAAAMEGYRPPVIVFENVTGISSRRNGEDLIVVVSSFIDLGYVVGAFFMDAKDFLPQSRPRLFVVAMRSDLPLPENLYRKAPDFCDGDAMTRHFGGLPHDMAKNVVSWIVPKPPERTLTLADIIDDAPDRPFMSEPDLARLLSLMNDDHRDRLEKLVERPGRNVCTLYKRGRPNAAGKVLQRAELRNDGLAGCLRTPSGGSSRQTILIADNGTLNARLFSSRELMRLMGLPDSYLVPARYNDAYKVAGDGVAVPVVKFLAESLLEPLLAPLCERLTV